jgi:hypothetical protein
VRSCHRSRRQSTRADGASRGPRRKTLADGPDRSSRDRAKADKARKRNSIHDAQSRDRRFENSFRIFARRLDDFRIWKILHERVRYEERGPAVSAEAKKVRTRKMIRELRSLGYRIEFLPTPSSSPA